MKKIFLTLIFFLFCTQVFADTYRTRYNAFTGKPDFVVDVISADSVTLDTSTFNSNLSVNDNTVQKALDTLDDAAGAPTTADYLTGTTQAGLSAEIVVGATPGGDLGGTWDSPSVNDDSHAHVIANIDAFTSAALHGQVSDETGSASGTPLAVFNQSPTINGATLTGALDAGGATSFEIPNAGADATLSVAGQVHFNTLDEQLSFHSGADGEISGEFSISGLRHLTAVFDPDAICDGAVDRVFLMMVGDDAPEGITIVEWKLSFEADPTTEVDLDLKYADAFIGVANATVIDVCDTLNGVSSEDTNANINGGAAIANGKVIYLEFGTAYTETTHQVIFEMWFYNEED